MLTIKTELKQSPIHGIGVFSVENIKTGDIIWRFNNIVDLVLSNKTVNSLDKIIQDCIRKYAWQDLKGNWILCGDDARFFNHSDFANCDESNSQVTVALKDIYVGEELTVNYRQFYCNQQAFL